MTPTKSLVFILFTLSGLLSSAAAYCTGLEEFSSQANLNFALYDLKGKKHSLSDYRGKVVLVNFWASQCVPCIREMPAMQHLADTLDKKDFKLLMLNIADSPSRIKKTLQRLQLDITVLLDHDGKVLKSWEGHVLPTSYLLDRYGRVRYRAVGVTQWNGAETSLKVKRLIQSR